MFKLYFDVFNFHFMLFKNLMFHNTKQEDNRQQQGKVKIKYNSDSFLIFIHCHYQF